MAPLSSLQEAEEGMVTQNTAEPTTARRRRMEVSDLSLPLLLPLGDGGVATRL